MMTQLLSCTTQDKENDMGTLEHLIILQTLDELIEREQDELLHELIEESQEAY